MRIGLSINLKDEVMVHCDEMMGQEVGWVGELREDEMLLRLGRGEEAVRWIKDLIE